MKRLEKLIVDNANICEELVKEATTKGTTVHILATKQDSNNMMLIDAYNALEEKLINVKRVLASGVNLKDIGLQEEALAELDLLLKGGE
jgi:hypothetical protein